MKLKIAETSENIIIFINIEHIVSVCYNPLTKFEGTGFTASATSFLIHMVDQSEYMIYGGPLFKELFESL